jgi:hypothetical protein
MVDNQYATERLFAEALAARSHTPITFELRVYSAAALAALTVALTSWVESDGGEELPHLVHQAFRTLTRTTFDSHTEGPGYGQ